MAENNLMYDWQALTDRIDTAVAAQQWQILADVDAACREALQANRQQSAGAGGAANSLTAVMREQKLAELQALAALQGAYSKALSALHNEQKDLQKQLQSLDTGRKAGNAYLAHT